MAIEEAFEKRKDYDVPLLRLLAELPGGQGKAGDVTSAFGQRYGHLIPEAHRGVYPNTGEVIWENKVAWSRNQLKKYGFLDPSTHGVWRITPEGRAWLETHPDASRLDAAGGRSAPRPRAPRAAARPAAPGITLEVLEQTRRAMPAETFRPLWGELYDTLLAAERAKQISDVSAIELGRRARRWLDDVHAFLRGRNAGVPAADVLCDWIQLCYALELHREAAALFPLVPEDEVDPAIYKRARRIAEVCRNKVTG